MTLREFRDILCGVGKVPVFHGEAHKSSEYIVWQEVSGTLGLAADGSEVEEGTRIAVDFYTKAEYSDIPKLIKECLEESDELCVDGPVIDFEEDTGYTHYSFDVEAYGG